MEDDKKVVCQHCGELVPEGNFCEICGYKIHRICPVCWKNDGQPFNCGKDACDGKFIN